MKILKVSSSGQITLPIAFRSKHPTNMFTYVIEGNKYSIIPVQIHLTPQIEKHKDKKAKYTIKDLPKGVFQSKDKKTTNLSDNIDQIVYR